MTVEFRSLTEIKPYDNNPRRHPESQLKALMESIRQFGIRKPIEIDESGVILCGHGRFQVYKTMGFIEIPVIIHRDLSETQKRAYRVIDNQLSIMSDWDPDMLRSELDLIIASAEIDMSAFETPETGDFKIPDELDISTDPGDDGERFEIPDPWNLNLYNPFNEETDVFGIPYLDRFPAKDFPKASVLTPAFIGGMDKAGPDQVCHFYIDDYRFERVWKRPREYLEYLMKFEAVFTPDYSLFMDMPDAIKIWNTYRARWLGRYWTDYGIRVIPSVSWAGPESYHFAFAGIKPRGVVAVSTVGCLNDENAIDLFIAGYKAMMERLEPSRVMIYGKEIQGLPGKISYYPPYYEKFEKDGK